MAESSNKKFNPNLEAEVLDRRTDEVSLFPFPFPSLLPLRCKFVGRFFEIKYFFFLFFHAKPRHKIGKIVSGEKILFPYL